MIVAGSSFTGHCLAVNFEHSFLFWVRKKFKELTKDFLLASPRVIICRQFSKSDQVETGATTLERVQVLEPERVYSDEI